MLCRLVGYEFQMNKLLVAVKSCDYDRNRGAHELVREMWGSDLKFSDLRFFTAKSAVDLKFDEICVNAPDDYPSLPYKTREIVRWALWEGYEHVFLCDTGSFVTPHHLESYVYETADYIGYWGLKLNPFPYSAQNQARGCKTIKIPRCYPWASGGGYFLSRKAMEIVAEQEPMCWAEDLNVGQALAAKGILLSDHSHQGFKGYVVDWIHAEDNSGGLEARRHWMAIKKVNAGICETTGSCAILKRSRPRFQGAQ